jgi:hypothetical protein
VHVDVLVFSCLEGGRRAGLGAARVGENLMGDHWWRPCFSWKENQKTKPCASRRTSFSWAAPYDCCPAVLHKWDVRGYHLGGGIVHRSLGQQWAADRPHGLVTATFVLHGVAGPCMMRGRGVGGGAGLPVGWGYR